MISSGKQGWLLLASFAAMEALAQGTYPGRPITIIVPWAPAGAADFLARMPTW